MSVVSEKSDRFSFSVEPLDEGASYYSGRTSAGNACLLVRTSNTGRTVPLLLAGLEANFGVPCLIRETHLADRTEVLTTVVCLSQSPETEEYFGRICDSLVGQLGPLPTAESAERGIQFLVDLFQRLSTPPRKQLAGLVGELCVIFEATNPKVAIEPWRQEEYDRFDFGIGGLRIDAKASSTRLRRHSFSIEQTRPPKGTRAFVASIFVEPLPVGIAIADLLDLIEERAQEIEAIGRLRLVVADSLGKDLPSAMRWRFDLQLARESLRFFDVENIPRLPEDIPHGVSDIHFVSDLSSAPPYSGDVWACPK
ncbi:MULTISPECIES: PD-(D/E)XK motif protein [unclassified Mesorhizobium]|uniref:PD-(D/E)XK motif protein n=1 Tax=unclassified Mesorhizobium TaxID=325217 RepID=UPI00333D3E89